MQIPHHDRRAVALAFKVMKWYKPDVVVNIGDLDDGNPTSRWTDGTPEEVTEAVPTYIDQVRDYWADVRKALPNARLAWTLGNHDIRHEEYARKKAPAIAGMLTPEFLWHTDKHGVEIYPYNKPPQLWMGDIAVHHGNAVSKHSGESVRADIDSWGVSLVRGHSHRVGYFAKTYEIRNELIQGWEIGHLMDVSKAEYSSVHNWQHGFALGGTHEGKGFVELVTINDYQCVIGGKMFTA